MNLPSLLKQLTSSFDTAADAYKNYINSGKTFRYAEILRKINDDTRTLLSENMLILPTALQDDAAAIIAHYNAWMEKWDELARRINPAPDDEFVFENNHRFPRDSAERIIHFSSTFTT